ATRQANIDVDQVGATYRHSGPHVTEIDVDIGKAAGPKNADTGERLRTTDANRDQTAATTYVEANRAATGSAGDGREKATCRAPDTIAQAPTRATAIPQNAQEALSRYC